MLILVYTNKTKLLLLHRQQNAVRIIYFKLTHAKPLMQAIKILITVWFRLNAGGVYSREAFTRGRRLLQNTEKVTILEVTSLFLSEKRNYLLHQRLNL